jgi:hypothetical protein
VVVDEPLLDVLLVVDELLAEVLLVDALLLVELPPLVTQAPAAQKPPVHAVPSGAVVMPQVPFAGSQLGTSHSPGRGQVIGCVPGHVPPEQVPEVLHVPSVHVSPSYQ